MDRAEALKLAREARAKNIPPLNERFWSKVNILDDESCWNWKAAVRNKKEGYGAFWYQGRHHPSSRIAYFLTTGVLEAKLVICHSCDNPSCCNPKHLFAGTRQDNEIDKVNKKRHVFGVRNGTSILNDDKVREIRRLKPYHTAKELGLMFGVDWTTISDVWRRKSWKHVI